MGENLIEVERFDPVLVQCCVERSQSEAWFLALDDLGKGVTCSDAVFRTVAPVDERPPVQLDAIPRGGRERNLPTPWAAEA